MTQPPSARAPRRFAARWGVAAFTLAVLAAASGSALATHDGLQRGTKSIGASTSKADTAKPARGAQLVAAFGPLTQPEKGRPTLVAGAVANSGVTATGVSR